MSNLRAWLTEKSSEQTEHFLGEIPRLWLESGQINKLYSLLSNYDFIEAKINHPYFGVQALIEDYELIKSIEISNYSEDHTEFVKVLRLIQKTLRLSAYILLEDKSQLAAQLLGRLLDFDLPKIITLLEQAKQCRNNTWLRPLRSSLTPPGENLLMTLTGHKNKVTAVTVTSDNKLLISGSCDGILKIWNLSTGKLLKSINAHNDTITSIAVTEDNKQIISVFNDLTVKVWNLTTSNLLLNFTIDDGSRITAVLVMPSSQYIVSASSNFYSKLNIWDLATGDKIFTLDAHIADVVAMGGTSDGKQLFSAFEDGTFKLWDLETGKLLSTFNQYNGVPIIVGITPDKKKMITINSNGQVYLYNYNTQQIFFSFSLNSHNHVINDFSIDMNSKHIISASKDKTIKIWELETGKNKFTITDHKNEVNAMTITPNSNFLISSYPDNSIKIFDINRKAKQNSIFNDKLSKNLIFKSQTNISTVILKILLNYITLSSRLFSFIGCFVYWILYCPLLAILFSISWTRILLVIFSHVLLLFHLAYLLYYIYSLIKNLLGFTSKSSIETITDYEDLECFYNKNKQMFIEDQILPLEHNTKSINSISILLNSKKIVSASNNGNLKIWDINNSKFLLNITKKTNFLFTSLTVLHEQIFIFHSGDGNLNICDLEIPNKVYILKSKYWLLHQTIRLGISSLFMFFIILLYAIIYNNEKEILNSSSILAYFLFLFFPFYQKFLNLIDNILGVKNLYINTIVVEPISNQAFSGSKDKNIRAWNLRNRKQTFTFKGHSDWVTAIALTPDGTHLISGSRDKTIKVWNLRNRKQIFTLKGHQECINAIVVTPDGKRVISSSRDTKIKIWDLETRQKIHTIEGHRKSVESIVLTLDGKYLISASSDTNLKVWNLENWELITSFTAEKALTCCAVDLDGVTIVVGDTSGNVHFLRLENIEVQR
ncbi:hypothetical protein [Nostoc sp. NMS8]|uniref:hypothetical protein n=1 Tax=Nostoc sp. NMS8 TaxID=2815392 RepID=UPI0025FABC3C|nr:hypothetical protein [Nostoc sp. NMS8]MBN3961526.1 hypothetical protein [Nostoc sp. NMS8]